MAKRFIDTGIFDDSWFMELSKDAKILWIYLITKCNHAGIIEYNKKLWEFHTGLKGLLTVIKELDNRLVTVKDTKYYFIPKFLTYQYPKFPNSKVRAQDSAIKILKRLGIFNEENLRVNKPLAKDYGYDYGYDNGYDNGYVDIDILKEKYLKNEKLVDSVIKLNKEMPYNTIEQLTKGLEKFNIQLKSKGNVAESFSEYANYFLNWSKLKKKKESTPFDNMAF